MTFKYRAINKSGAIVADVLTVDSRDEACAELARRGLTPVHLEGQRQAASTRAAGMPILAWLSGNQEPDPKKASKRQLPFFTAQMSILLETGTTVASALEAIGRQVSCPHWSALTGQLRKHVEEGGSLASAVGTCPTVFDPVYSNMISAGEKAGNMSEIFRRLAELARQSGRIRSKVVSAMIYPALLTVIAISVVITLVFFVLPRFEALFEELGVDLPASTKAFLAVSHVCREQALIVVPLVAGAIAGIVYWLRSANGRRLIQTISIKLPLVGTLISSIIIARVFRLFGLLVTSNVSLVESLELTASSMQNYLYAKLLDDVRESVLEGRSMYEVLDSSPLMPASVAEMIHTGEENGKLGKVATMLADHLDDSNETQVNTLTSILEPAVLIVMGGIIGTVVMSLVLPMFDLSKISG